MGTKTAVIRLNLTDDTPLVKKESPNMGTKTNALPSIGLGTSCEKRIPKHGDEGKTCVALIVGEIDYP